MLRFLMENSMPARMLALSTLFMFALPVLRAQFAPPPPATRVNDAGALQPPTGAKVAIIEFEDLECSDCARANPMLMDAAAKYGIPWVKHDFPLPFHKWSFEAAINARWFDTNSKAVGDEYRNEVFAHQPSIVDPAGLRAFTEKFAKAHNLVLPANVDPNGELTEKVKADYALGQKVGVEHTPTIWVVTANSKGAPFVEVVDRMRLDEMIQQALAETGEGRK